MLGSYWRLTKFRRTDRIAQKSTSREDRAITIALVNKATTERTRIRDASISKELSIELLSK